MKISSVPAREGRGRDPGLRLIWLTMWVRCSSEGPGFHPVPARRPRSRRSACELSPQRDFSPERPPQGAPAPAAAATDRDLQGKRASRKLSRSWQHLRRGMQPKVSMPDDRRAGHPGAEASRSGSIWSRRDMKRSGRGISRAVYFGTVRQREALSRDPRRPWPSPYSNSAITRSVRLGAGQGLQRAGCNLYPPGFRRGPPFALRAGLSSRRPS